MVINGFGSAITGSTCVPVLRNKKEPQNPGLSAQSANQLTGDAREVERRR